MLSCISHIKQHEVYELTVLFLVENSEGFFDFASRISVVLHSRQHLQKDVEIDQTIACNSKCLSHDVTSSSWRVMTLTVRIKLAQQHFNLLLSWIVTQ